MNWRKAAVRLKGSMWRQRATQLPAPDARVDGLHAVVTGGNGGIGLATARGLAERGARVTLLCRRPEAARRAAEQVGHGCTWHAMDLAELASVRRAADALGPVDVLVNNAGIWPLSYSETQDGWEVSFGVNVLGHALLVQRLLDRGMLAEGARVIWVTGDIYVLQGDCTEDYRYRTAWGGQLAYARSKLGNLWLRHAFAERYPACDWYAVHPGVVRTGLGTDKPGPDWLVGAAFLTPEEGARTSLRCATGSVAPGYHHNTRGEMTLDPDDPGADHTRALGLLDRCLEILAPHLADGVCPAA